MSFEKNKNKNSSPARKLLKGAGKVGVKGAVSAVKFGQQKIIEIKETDARLEAEAKARHSAEYDRRLQDRNAEYERKIADRDALYEKSKGFDIAAFAEKRRTTEPWVTVELGPGFRPSGLNREFKGKSAYIAIDADTNPEFSADSEEAFEKITTKRPGENIFNMRDGLIGRAHADDEDGHIGGKRSDQEIASLRKRGHDVVTSDRGSVEDTDHYWLPDGSADEIFVVYTFDDPSSQSGLIIDEAQRMLKPGGSMIVWDKEKNFDSISTLIEFRDLKITYAASGSTWDGDESKAVFDNAQALGCYQTAVDGDSEMYGSTDIIDSKHLLMIVQKPGEEPGA